MTEKVYYRSRLKEIRSLFKKQPALEHIATAIDATRQTMYDWNSDRLFERPNMQIAANLSNYFNDLAREQMLKNWSFLEPYDLLEIVRVQENGDTIDENQIGRTARLLSSPGKPC